MRDLQGLKFYNTDGAEIEPYSVENPPPYPVTSVNGKKGDVSISKTDVGLSQVVNERQYSANNPPPHSVITGLSDNYVSKTSEEEINGKKIFVASGTPGSRNYVEIDTNGTIKIGNEEVSGSSVLSRTALQLPGSTGYFDGFISYGADTIYLYDDSYRDRGISRGRFSIYDKKYHLNELIIPGSKPGFSQLFISHGQVSRVSRGSLPQLLPVGTDKVDVDYTVTTVPLSDLPNICEIGDSSLAFVIGWGGTTSSSSTSKPEYLPTIKRAVINQDKSLTLTFTFICTITNGSFTSPGQFTSPELTESPGTNADNWRMTLRYRPAPSEIVPINPPIVSE